jgi:hypothetical protein
MRLVALGASNLTRGLQAVVATARQAWGPDVEVLAALGHGRSYGATSRFLVRSLPGILECGLWRALDQEPAPTRALVTDVGNDILYGHDVRRILGWVEECVARLQAVSAEVAITDLPLAGIRRLGPARFLFFRSLFVPSCRLSLEAVSDAAERVSDGLVELAARRSLRLVRLRAEWYGLDPIHVRPRCWWAAWEEIVGVAPVGRAAVGPAPGAGRRASRTEALLLYLAQPARVRWLGHERRTVQSGRPLPGGGRLRLY